MLLINGAATVRAETAIQMTVINKSHMEISCIDFSKPTDKQIVAKSGGLPVSIDIERPNVETNMAMLSFKFKNYEQSGTAAFPLVRAPKDLLDFLAVAPEFIVTFYDENGQTWAGISRGLGNAAEAGYLYHPVLNNWGFVETDAGIAVYQDDKGEWNTYEKARAFDATVPTAWEHLYPGEMTEWLRSPLETRGFIVPLNEICNVDVWAFEDFENLQPSEIHFDKVTCEQLIVVKAMGDLGHGMVTFQDKGGQWFFLTYGYDGMGAYGGMTYRIHTLMPDHIKTNGIAVPWEKTD